MSRGVFSVSCLGRMGRFGNAILQYMFAKTYAKRHDIQAELPSWVGNYLFGVSDLPMRHRFPVFTEKTWHGSDDALIPNLTEVLVNRDIRGYFQYHTSYYAPYRNYLTGLLSPATHLRLGLEVGWSRISNRGRTPVGIHLRRGDYGQDCFYLTPVDWYLDKLEELWPTLDQPFLYCATEDLPLALKSFARYNPVTVGDLGVDIPYRRDFPQLNEQEQKQQIPYFADWYALTRCRYLLMPNSSFSFTAAMLAPEITCWRSSLPARGFIPVDPWDDQPVLTGPEARVENFMDIPGLIAPQYYEKYGLK